jgi:hypothetical protein
VALYAAKHFRHISGFQKREMVPAFQFRINPAGDGQKLMQGTHLRSRAQGRSHEMPDDLGIEGVAGETDAGVADQVAGNPSPLPNGRADAQK